MVENILYTYTFKNTIHTYGIRQNLKAHSHACECGIRKEKETIVSLAQMIKKVFKTQLLDISIIDYLNTRVLNRFQINYLLVSLSNANRIRLALKAKLKATIYSLTSIFNSANWLEREAFDLFGILFRNHPDIRRILSDYGFEGHPLRKDFPLVGFLEVRYAHSSKGIINEYINLNQLFRQHEFAQVWEDTQSVSNVNYIELGTNEKNK